MVSSKCKGLLTAKNLMGRLASYPNRNTTTSEDEDPPKEVATDKSGSLRFCSDEIIVQDEECGHEDDSIDDDDSHKCLICLEKFQVEDVVSWASNDGCNHVFHHSCLRKWLLRKTNCPCCRNTVLSVDQPRPGKYPQRRRRLTTEEIGILASKRANRTTSTYFCIQEGLVELYGFAITTVTTTSPHSTKTLTNLSAVDTTTTSGGAGTPTTANQEEDDPKHPHHHYHHHHHHYHHHRWMRPRRFWQRNDKQGEEQQAAVDNEQVPTTPSTLRNDTFMEDDFSSSSSCSEDQDEGDDLEQGRRRTRRSKDTARPVELVFESEGDNQDEIDTKANKYDSEEQQYGEDERNESQSTENDSGSSDGATPVYATTLAVGAISANSTLLDNEPKEELTASREVVEEKEDEERILCA